MREFINWLYDIDEDILNKVYDIVVIGALISACIWLFN